MPDKEDLGLSEWSVMVPASEVAYIRQVVEAGHTEYYIHLKCGKTIVTAFGVFEAECVVCAASQFVPCKLPCTREVCCIRFKRP